MKTDYVLYTIVHSFLGTQHKGVQGLHAGIELVWQTKNPAIKKWFKHHKTAVMLEGGNSYALRQLINKLQRSDLPFKVFREDKNTLDGIVTSVSVVIDRNVKPNVRSLDAVEHIRGLYPVRG